MIFCPWCFICIIRDLKQLSQQNITGTGSYDRKPCTNHYNTTAEVKSLEVQK